MLFRSELEFEYFHLDSDVYGPPYNRMAPYRGDCLTIYDASAVGCAQAVLGRYGQTTYTLLDSSLLVELQSYTGEGSNVFSLATERTVNATPNGAFTSPAINTTSRICIVLYSDASHPASGFKLKGGPRHAINWSNYDIDLTNGQVWIHKYPLGNSPTTEIRAIYDYYDQATVIDYDAGTVTFENEPVGEVTADYTYYDYDETGQPVGGSRLFAASSDDFVDYDDVGLYVCPTGTTPDKTDIYVHDYPVPTNPTGKVLQNFTTDKDRGLVEFSDGTTEYAFEYANVPPGRLFMDYNHHTYLRLSNDGYSGFTFRDSVIVADDTPQYTDYTYGDVKIVNEGDAILEDGRMRFVMRGYDNDGDGTVDQVLDINRPWDIQKGTEAETYGKVAMEVKTSYTWDTSCTKVQARTILSTWANAYFGFDVEPQQVFYGRVVWVLGGTSGSNYPNTTTGEKAFSAELEGRYYNIEV